MSESAGRVLLIPKGAYDGSATYSALDVVSYGHNSYVAKQATTGNLPTDTTYWQILTNVTADASPTSGSTNLVESGGVYSELALKANAADLGTAAAKNSTNAVTENSTDLVESGAVYAKTEPLWDNMKDNGSVNSLGITKAELHALNTDGTWSGETYTNNSATFACEYDDDGYLKKVTVNKSTGGNSILTLKKTPKFPYLPIKLTGCPSGGESKYYIYYANWSTSDGVVFDYGDGATITSQFDYSTYPSARLAIRINSGQTVSNLIFYPMLSDPSLNLSYDDYVPYAMTNRELTKYSRYYCGGARRKLFGLENNTSFTAKIPKSVCALYEQFNIKLRGNNNSKYYDSVIFVNCTRNNDAINNSSIINNADTGVTINASIDGDFVKIVVSGLTTYVRLELEYFNGNMINDPLQDDWQFIAGA